jgi:hypothetical protein
MRSSQREKREGEERKGRQKNKGGADGRATDGKRVE